MLFMSNSNSEPKSEAARSCCTRSKRCPRRRPKSTRLSQSTPITAPGDAIGVKVDGSASGVTPTKWFTDMISLSVLNEQVHSSPPRSNGREAAEGRRELGRDRRLTTTYEPPRCIDDLLHAEAVLREQVRATARLGERVGKADSPQRTAEA